MLTSRASTEGSFALDLEDDLVLVHHVRGILVILQDHGRNGDSVFILADLDVSIKTIVAVVVGPRGDAQDSTEERHKARDGR